MSNYPPGVTGLEPQIAGADEREITSAEECTDCGFTSLVSVTETIGHVGRDEITGDREWLCPECGSEQTEYDVVLADSNDN